MTPTIGRGDWPRASIAAVAALVCYLALGQNILHGIDAYFYLRWVEIGELQHPRSVLYLPVAVAWSRTLALFGVDTYEALRALSSVGAAAGVLCSYFVGRRLQLAQDRSLQLALGCAAVPAVMYSASVVEVDAILFGWSCVCWLPFAGLLRSNRWAAAVATGMATAVAAGFHAAGHLLAGTLCCLQLGWGWPERRLGATVPRALVLGGVHLVLVVAMTVAAGATEQAQMATNTIGHAFQMDFVGHVLLQEWLLPYLPFAALALFALRHRNGRGFAVAWCACLLGYLYVTAKILGYQRFAAPYLTQGDIVERGTFLFGIALPMVLLSLRGLGQRAAWAAIVVAAISGAVQIGARDWPDDPPDYAAGVTAAEKDGPVTMFVADTREWAWVARRHPEVVCTLLPKVLVMVDEDRRKYGAVLEPGHYTTWFDTEIARATALGFAYLITERALEAMRRAEDPALAAAVPLLQQSYGFEPLHVGDFAAWRLRKR